MKNKNMTNPPKNNPSAPETPKGEALLAKYAAISEQSEKQPTEDHLSDCGCGCHKKR